MKIAALYLRVSTEDQAKEGYSLEVQRETLEAFAKREGFEYIRPAAKAAVDEYWNSVTNFGHDFRQCLNRCAQSIRGTSAVIRYEHAIDAVFDA